MSPNPPPSSRFVILDESICKSAALHVLPFSARCVLMDALRVGKSKSKQGLFDPAQLRPFRFSFNMLECADGASRRTYGRALRELVRVGFLTLGKRGSGEAHLVTFIDKWEGYQPTPEESARVGKPTSSVKMPCAKMSLLAGKKYGQNVADPVLHKNGSPYMGAGAPNGGVFLDPGEEKKKKSSNGTGGRSAGKWILQCRYQKKWKELASSPADPEGPFTPAEVQLHHRYGDWYEETIHKLRERGVDFRGYENCPDSCFRIATLAVTHGLIKQDGRTWNKLVRVHDFLVRVERFNESQPPQAYKAEVSTNGEGFEGDRARAREAILNLEDVDPGWLGFLIRKLFEDVQRRGLQKFMGFVSSLGVEALKSAIETMEPDHRFGMVYQRLEDALEVAA